MLEENEERSCFALPGNKKLQTWEEGDWSRFLDYQEELRKENVLHMGPYLWGKEACRGQVERWTNYGNSDREEVEEVVTEGEEGEEQKTVTIRKGGLFPDIYKRIKDTHQKFYTQGTYT